MSPIDLTLAQHPLSPDYLKAVCRAVTAVATGRAGDESPVHGVAMTGASCPHCGCRCCEGQGDDDLFHFSSPSLNTGWCCVNEASNVSPSGLVKEDAILEGLLCVEEVGTLLLNPADGGIQLGCLAGKLQIVLKVDG